MKPPSAAGPMTDGVGVLRTAESLTAAAEEPADMVVGDLPQGRSDQGVGDDEPARDLVGADAHALARHETRGSHWREDYPRGR